MYFTCTLYDSFLMQVKYTLIESGISGSAQPNQTCLCPRGTSTLVLCTAMKIGDTPSLNKISMLQAAGPA